MPERNRDESVRGQETHRKYIKFKMKQIKKYEKRGNHAKAERHATELLQYLGLDGESETPIEGVIDQVGLPHRTATRRFD